MGIIQQAVNRVIYPAAYMYLSVQSRVNQIKDLFKSDNVIYAAPYGGQKVVLMALYQKGELRADVAHVLACAKEQGAYVICVNTLKLKLPERYSGVIDCYIEKYNFGRDFSSYKSGFSYIYKQSIGDECERVLMINDSVYYSKNKSDKFVRDMLSSSCEVLGGTENFEFEHHMGSFCISFSGGIIRAKKFKKYWQAYKNSDVRPVVIKRGELELSRMLKRCVSSPDNFRSLYDLTRASMYIKDNPAVLDEIIKLSRSPDNKTFKGFSFSDISQKVVSKYLHNSASLTGVESFNADLEDLGALDVYYAQSVEDYFNFIFSSIVNGAAVSDSLRATINEEFATSFLELFIKGSPIHLSAIFLHRLGLPLIKLDGLYRGAFIVRDVEVIAGELAPEEGEAFRRLLYARPFGCDTLFGWKRAAFERGLI